MGVAAQSAADRIENAIRNESEQWWIKIPAAQALMRIGVKQDVAYPVLLDALDEQLDPYVKSEIIGDLGRFQSLGASGLERISTELDAEDSQVRCAAAFVLARNATDVKRSLSIITEALNDQDDETRWSAVVAIGRLNSISTSTIDRLIQVAQDDEVQAVRLAAIWALGHIGRCKKQLVEPFLVRLLSDADEETDCSIRHALEHLREEG